MIRCLQPSHRVWQSLHRYFSLSDPFIKRRRMSLCRNDSSSTNIPAGPNQYPHRQHGLSSSILLTSSMVKGITKYHTAQYADPMVLLPRSGCVYLKSDKAPMGYYIMQSSSNICEMLELTTRTESHFFCTQLATMVILHIDVHAGAFLASQQLVHYGKKMWAALVKLQRWFRRFPQKYHVPRRIAVAMCLHERLGEGSKLGSIGADMLIALLTSSRCVSYALC